MLFFEGSCPSRSAWQAAWLASNEGTGAVLLGGIDKIPPLGKDELTEAAIELAVTLDDAMGAAVTTPAEAEETELTSTPLELGLALRIREADEAFPGATVTSATCVAEMLRTEASVEHVVVVVVSAARLDTASPLRVARTRVVETMMKRVDGKFS